MTLPDSVITPVRSGKAFEPPDRWRSMVVFIACTLVAVVLVVGGLAVIERRAAAVARPAPEAPVTVSVRPVALQSGYQIKHRHVGLVEPARQTDLAFEAGGTLVQVLVEEGDSVEQDAPLARLDTRGLRAERAARQASRAALISDLERAELALQRQRSLQVRDFTDGQSLDDARLLVIRTQAMIEQAEAGIEAIDVSLDKAVLRAPFDAEIGRQSIDEGTSVMPGTAVATLFERNAPVVRIGLPVEVTRALDPASTYSINVGGIDYPATLLSRRQDVSARTRTVDVRFRLDTSVRAPRPAFGQTAILTLQQVVATPGYRVPVSALSEGEAGLWSLLLAVPDEPGTTEAARVVREHVTVLHSDGTDAFVQGQFPEDAALIQAGPHRVAAGQWVRSVARAEAVAR